MFKWKSILVATDFSEVGETAVATAVSVAKRGKSTLSVVYVADRPPPFAQPLLDRVGPVDPDELWTREARRSMAKLLNRLRRDIPDARGFVRVGTPWQEIVKLAGELRVDAIALGSVGHSLVERLLLGGTAEGVVRNAPCPVLVLRKGPLETIRRVLLPIDMDEGSRTAVRYALRRLDKDVELDAVHVITFPRLVVPELVNALPDDAESARRLRAFLDEHGAKRIPSRVILGEPAAAIIDASRETDLVLIATHGRKGLARALMGSVAEKVVRHSDAPVLVLPGPRSRSRKPRRAAEIEGEVLP